MSEKSALHPWTRQVLEAGEKSKITQRLRMDSWANTLTGLNTTRDKTTSTVPYADVIFSPQILETMYHHSDTSARIVSALPDEAFKRQAKVVSKSAMRRAGVFASVGGNYEGASQRVKEGSGFDPRVRDNNRADVIERVQKKTTVDDAAIAAELTARMVTRGTHAKLHEGWIWGRLYGLGGALIGADDGQPSWLPLDPSRVASLDYITVLDKRDLTPMRWYSNVQAPKFGDVAIYMIQPVGVFMGAPYDLRDVNQILMVHESRLIRFGGELTSKRERLRNQGADYSILQKCFRALQLVDNNWQSASVLLADASQGVYKIKDLINMISQEPDVMQNRMALIDQMKSVCRGIILDADGEEYARIQTPFTGIPQMLEQTWSRLAAAARMPKTILMGMSPGGLNATGESDLRWWYDTVSCAQELTVKPWFEYLLQLDARAMGLANPNDWTVVFPPLWSLNEAEIAKLHSDQATADNLYVQMGAVRPEEIAISRFGKGEYSLETEIDSELRAKVLQLSAQQLEVQATTDLENAINPPEPPPTTPEPKPPGEVEN